MSALSLTMFISDFILYQLTIVYYASMDCFDYSRLLILFTSDRVSPPLMSFFKMENYRTFFFCMNLKLILSNWKKILVVILIGNAINFMY